MNHYQPLFRVYKGPGEIHPKLRPKLCEFQTRWKNSFPIPRMTRARATDTPRVARPVALTPWQDTRLLWQAGGRRFASVMMTASKRYATLFRNISFLPFLSLSLSPQGSGKGTFRRSPSQQKKRALSPPTDQGFEGCALRGSATALEHSGSEPFTDQGFEGWPLEGIR
jgi:hypothetical protein